MRKVLVGFALVAMLCLAAYFRFHRKAPALQVAYAGERETTLWNSTAQVRAPVGTLAYGDRVQVVQQLGDEVQVRTAAGVTGWISDNELLSAAFWLKAKELEEFAAKLPVEARGHTRVLANLHLEPGRAAPRIRQLGKDIAVDLFARRVAEIPSEAGVPETDDEVPPKSGSGKKEDWWLIRAYPPNQDPLAGWILGRFIDLDVPQPLPDYASSAGMRIVGWFELNRVMGNSGAAKPQYLVLGARGAEGQLCDFTMLRVFTWGKQRDRYETAFVQSDVCGKLPVTFTRSRAASGGDVTFAFEDRGGGTSQARTYFMHQTIVREARKSSAPRPR